MEATFNMTQLTINFAHANGFPAASYRQLFEHLPEQIEVLAKPRYGHEPHFPVSRNWDNQINEMAQFIEANVAEPVIGVGHSFGALLTLLTSIARPDLFKGLILIEPPAFTGVKARTIQFLKMTRMINKVPLAKLARNRRNGWAIDEDIVAYFRGKALFKEFSDTAIADYVTAGMVQENDAYKLFFKPEVEADIFLNVPHHLHKLRGKMTRPATLITAANGGVVNGSGIARLCRYFDLSHHIFHQGGHLFPLEKPSATAKLIQDLLQPFLADKEQKNAD